MALQLPQKSSEGSFIAIDFGTSVSRMAYARGDVVVFLPDLPGEISIPSVLALSPQGGVVAGAAARERETLFPHETLLSPRFLLSADAAQLQDHGPFLPQAVATDSGPLLQLEIGGRQRSSIELGAIFLAFLRRTAEFSREEPVRSVVLTVPVAFSPFDRQALRLAAGMAGFQRVRLIDEPTAVALSWAAQGGRGRVAVCSWGAGYFSASIMQIEAELVRVLGTVGSVRVGGNALDRALAGDFLGRVRKECGASFENEAHVARYILVAAEAAKREIVQRRSAALQFAIAGRNRPFKHTYEQADLAAWLEPLKQRVGSLCEGLLADAGLEKGDLETLVVAGGMTRIDSLTAHLSEIFGRQPIEGVDVEEAAVRGAVARCRHLQHEGSEKLVLDPLPAACGLEGQGGRITAILERGVAIPARKLETFTTYLDQQTEVGVQLFSQQENEWVSLAQVEISKIVPMKAGQPVVEIAFQVDEDGILEVAAREVTRGKALGVELRPHRGLAASQVSATLEGLPKGEEEDFAASLRRALRERASFLLRSVRDAVRKHPGTMTRDEKQLITKKIKEMEEILDAGDLAEIRGALLELEEVAQPLKRRILDASLQSLLR